MAAGGVFAYEDIFEILDQDPDGKKFDHVSRYRCRSAFESDLQIDLNIDIYKLEVRCCEPWWAGKAAAKRPDSSRFVVPITPNSLTHPLLN
jgi:hypothetical protein